MKKEPWHHPIVDISLLFCYNEIEKSAVLTGTAALFSTNDLTGSPESAEGGKHSETYQMGDIVSRRCFCSAQGLIRDETCTERSEHFVRSGFALHENRNM